MRMSPLCKVRMSPSCVCFDGALMDRGLLTMSAPKRERALVVRSIVAVRHQERPLLCRRQAFPNIRKGGAKRTSMRIRQATGIGWRWTFTAVNYTRGHQTAVQCSFMKNTLTKSERTLSRCRGIQHSSEVGEAADPWCGAILCSAAAANCLAPLG